MTIEDIALQMTPGIGVKGAVHLLGVFGSARNIFAAAPDELAGEAGLRGETAPENGRRRGFAAPGKEPGDFRRHGIAGHASARLLYHSPGPREQSGNPIPSSSLKKKNKDPQSTFAGSELI